ncbi:MAG: hypothetical protein GX749_04335 [Ruminococcaceae bacterium]|nr:hypothetical protein [Oscillospiraceae bacterium]
MSIKDVKCRNCSKTFQADDEFGRVFCTYCGTENMIIRENTSDSITNLPEDPLTRRELLERLAASDSQEKSIIRDRLLFWAARYVKLSRKEERYGDKFLELITTLLFFSHNYGSPRLFKRARKDYDRFFNTPEFQKAMSEAADTQQALRLEFLDAAILYLRSCREDKHYGSRLFDIVRLKDDQIALKAATDIANNIMYYLYQLGMPQHADLLIQALHRGWSTIFMKFPELLNEAIAALPDDGRAAIYRAIASETNNQEGKA